MLKGRTALVTGSTSGIGLGIALSLAQRGVNIVLNGFGDVAGPRAQVEAAGPAGLKVGYHGADMSKPDEIAQMITATEKRFGSIRACGKRSPRSSRMRLMASSRSAFWSKLTTT